MISESAIHHDIRGEEIEPAIQSRTIRLGRAPQRWFHHLLLLTGGTMRIARNKDGATQAPALVFFPPSGEETVVIDAGGRGVLVGASPEIIGEAIGDHAESASLRLFSGTFSLNDGMEGIAARQTAPLFEGIMAELALENRASRMVVAAYVRLIMMAAWRMGGAEHETAPRSGPGPILQHFRQSVEIGFRHHRTIGDYAGELGISTDRLHAICQRTLGRSPIELVHERMMREAKLRLERSARTVQEIADGLGFRDPANFSNFFKKRAGISPARYRAIATSPSGKRSTQTSSDYHEWP
jgi:AraC-like DNA-binding protein